MAHGGDALGRADGQVVFTAYGIPGEVVEAEVYLEKKGYSLAWVREVLTPSAHRTTPPCPYFGRCGGCQWQHIAYPYQLELKKRVVAEQMRRIGKMPQTLVTDTLPSPQQWHYRNHARFSVWEAGLGFVHRETYRTLRIDYCMIMDHGINMALAQLQDQGITKDQVVVRYGVNTGQWLVQPQLGPEVGIPSGQSYYEEELWGRRFRISAASFFQVNTHQVTKLATAVREAIPPGTELVVDAYAGVGTFGVLLAPYVGRVIAIEEATIAVGDAQVNIRGLSNVQYLTGKTETVLTRLEERPQVVILDPPRQGCREGVVSALARLRPRKILYISCDPATLARDLLRLTQGGFQVVQVQPIDMFPQTFHIECLATLVFP